MANNNIERDLGRIFEMMERGKEDRAEMLERMTAIDNNLTTLNGRTRKLEDDNAHSKEVWKQVAAMSAPVEELRKQVAAMREPFQVVSSGISVGRRWFWRIMIIGVIAVSAGNQAGRVILDYILKQFGVDVGVGSG
jgi:septation ring formation regulator EzrA